MEAYFHLIIIIATLYLSVLTESRNVNVFLNLNFFYCRPILVFYSGLEACVGSLSTDVQYNLLEELRVSTPSKQAISVLYAALSKAVTEKITLLYLACALRFPKKCALEVLEVACVVHRADMRCR